MGRGTGSRSDGFEFSGSLLDSRNFWEGFAGTTKGSFFSAPSWVDESRAPGTSDQTPKLKDNPDWSSILSGSTLFWSPNLVWLLVALFDYLVFPYDLESAKSWAIGWIAYRAAVNVGIVFTYGTCSSLPSLLMCVLAVGFWHLSCYWLGWASRPFKPNRMWSSAKIVHNMWYTFLGCIQWTAWEAVFMHCYATGRLPYLSDDQATGSLWGALNVVAACFWVPIWREAHFYFAHRLIHVKFLYKYVHALHHRNTDIEPFAGLSMHPIEHIYYFACFAPSLWLFTSPFAFMWNGVHLMISPAASHSGWEDHFQSDQFHYLHHRFFECNYGTGTFPFDYWFGTFRESLDPESKSYMGEHKKPLDDNKAASHDAKATLIGLPKNDELIFNLLCCGLFPGLLVCAVLEMFNMHRLSATLKLDTFITNGQLLGFLVTFGPAVVGLLLLIGTAKSLKGYNHPLYPFHTSHKNLSFHMIIGVLIAVLPAYQAIVLMLSPPGEVAYGLLAF